MTLVIVSTLQIALQIIYKISNNDNIVIICDLDNTLYVQIYNYKNMT